MFADKPSTSFESNLLLENFESEWQKDSPSINSSFLPSSIHFESTSRSNSANSPKADHTQDLIYKGGKISSVKEPRIEKLGDPLHCDNECEILLKRSKYRSKFFFDNGEPVPAEKLALASKLKFRRSQNTYK